MMHISTE